MLVTHAFFLMPYTLLRLRHEFETMINQGNTAFYQ